MTRPGCLVVRCALFVLLTSFTSLVFADATLYGLPAFEGDFLTEAFQSTSIAVGSDGVITLVDKSATDRITAHGTYAATYIQSGDNILFQASGPLYVESMACAIDTRFMKAQCTLSQSISGEGVKSNAFPLTTLFVAAVVPTVSPTPSSSSDATFETIAQPTPTLTSGQSKVKGSDQNQSSGLSIGIIIAIIAAAGGIFVLLLVWFLIRRRRARLQAQEENNMQQPHYPPINEYKPMDSRSVISYGNPQTTVTYPGNAHFSSVGSDNPYGGMSPVSPSRQTVIQSVYHDRHNTIMTQSSQSSSSALANNDAHSSASTEKEQMRQYYLANSDERGPQSAISPVSGSNSLAGPPPSEGTVSVTEARQILEEMRRMREEVDILRGTSPPEYTA